MGKQEIITDLQRLYLYENDKHIGQLLRAYKEDERLGVHELMYSKGYNNISSTKGKS